MASGFCANNQNLYEFVCTGTCSLSRPSQGKLMKDSAGSLGYQGWKAAGNSLKCPQ